MPCICSLRGKKPHSIAHSISWLSGGIKVNFANSDTPACSKSGKMYPVYYGNELLLKLCGEMGLFYTVAANANDYNCFESWSAFPKDLRLRVLEDPTTDFLSFTATWLVIVVNQNTLVIQIYIYIYYIYLSICIYI